MSAPQRWQICSPGVPEGRGSFAGDVMTLPVRPFPILVHLHIHPAPEGPPRPLLLILAALWTPQNQTAWRRVPEAVGLSVTCCDAVTCINPT